jgi:hypothetical protein
MIKLLEKGGFFLRQRRKADRVPQINGTTKITIWSIPFKRRQ